jgi:hypothetical protein
VDTDRAIEVLEWWIAAARRAPGSSSGSVSPGTAVFAELQAREDQTRRVLAHVQGSSSLPDILSHSMYNDDYWVSGGIRQAEYALGKLRTDAQTRAILGSVAPTMAADALHPLIWDAASKRWDAGHYSDAVQRAATFLNANVQDATGRRDVSDSALMQQTFSLEPPQPERPRLRWPGNDDDLNVKTMRVGILNMAQGVFSAIRNPATHSTDDVERQEALEQLATLSILARWIDRCELVTVEPEAGI